MLKLHNVKSFELIGGKQGRKVDGKENSQICKRWSSTVTLRNVTPLRQEFGARKCLSHENEMDFTMY